MAVVVDSGPIRPTARRDDVPRAQWAELVRARRSFCRVNLPYDCRELLHFVEDAPEMIESLGYVDVDDFIRRGLELEPAMVAWAIKGLESLRPNEPIPFERAVHLGRHGGDHTSPKGKAIAKAARLADNLARGTGSPYLLARLDRDHPNVAAEVRAGKLKAKTAARQVGIIRTKSTLQRLQALWQKLSPGDREVFRKWIANP